MGNVDGVPVASQMKAVVSASRGDMEAAKESQSRFTERCIGVAQVRSAVEAFRGDLDAASDTQLRFLANTRQLLSNNEFADAVPGVSQLKAIALLEADRQDEAIETQMHFMKRCPIISQARSAYEFIYKGPDEAIETQMEFLSFASTTLDSVPGVGHVKAWVHGQMGDDERASESATRADRNLAWGQQRTAAALADILGSSSSDLPEIKSNTCGPLSEDEIRENTVLFNMTLEQCVSHNSCPVCMVEFLPEEEARILRCFHIFHVRCSEEWLMRNGNCPVCRVGAKPLES